jgi:V/A-type H+-transporting ATPase subunit E
MKQLEKGQDKIDKICEILKKETLEPAQRQAQDIIDEALEKAERIVADADKQAERIIGQARLLTEQERNVFQSSLSQAAKQSVEALRQSVEHKLFNEELTKVVDETTADPKIIAKLIDCIVQAIGKEGVDTDLTAVIPKQVSAESVNRLLIEGILKRLKDQSVTVGTFAGGAQVKLLGKKMTIDISDKALKELLAGYVRKDFRKLIFNA